MLRILKAFPYAFASNFPADIEAKVTAQMDKLDGDFGCIETIKVERADLLTTPYNFGIMYRWKVGGGCFSGLGVSPGQDFGTLADGKWFKILVSPEFLFDYQIKLVISDQCHFEWNIFQPAHMIF